MDLRGRLDRSGDLQTSLRSSVGGRSSISELDTRDLQDFLADDYVETYEGPRTPARPPRARGGGDGAAAAARSGPPPAVVALAPARRASRRARARLRADDGRRLVNGYELLGELGRGAFGTVELCERRGDLYAVKILRKSLLRKARTGRGRGANALADARREIAIMKKLDHANLVGLVEAVDDEKAGKLYLVLDYVDCGPVLERRKSGDPPYVAIDAVAARAACRDVLRGLESGVVHLDVKPENVLLTSGGVAKLCDFGVSRLARGGAGDAAVFASTPAFSAPELCGYGAGSAAAPAVDAWALGATVHAMVSGAPPVPRGTPAATVARLGAGERVVRPTGDGRLDALLARLLDVDATTRATIPEAMASPWLDPPMTPVAYVGAAVRPEDLEAALTARSAAGSGPAQRAVGGLARRALGRGAALPRRRRRGATARLDALRCSLSGGRAGADDDGFGGAEALSDSGLDATFDALCGVGDGDESDDDGAPGRRSLGASGSGRASSPSPASSGAKDAPPAEDARPPSSAATAPRSSASSTATAAPRRRRGSRSASRRTSTPLAARRTACRAFAAADADADLLRHLDDVDSSAGATAVVAVFERVKASGAHWANGGRVNGVLRVSRAFGDRDFKGARAPPGANYAADPIIAAPAVVARDRRADDAVLALATDGVGDAFPDPAGPAAFARARLRAHGDVDRRARETLAEASARRHRRRGAPVGAAFHAMDAAKVEQAMEETGLQLQVKCHESWDKFCDVVEAKGTYGPKAAEFLRRIVVDAPVVLGFAFVCCAVFFVNVVAPGTNVFVACPPFRMASPLNPLTYLRLLTHTVGHTGYDHLKGNMVNLLLVGPASEKEFGSMNLLKIFLYVAVSSAVAHMALGPANGYQLGASGVVFALILLNSLLSAHSGVVPLTFLLTAGLWVSDEVFRFFFARDQVSHVAHLSGAVVGTLAGYAIHADRAKLRAAQVAKSWLARARAKRPRFKLW
ncbi:protein serine/threonine phosphatase [Aureococcus anophagefferens]|uniref:Protein serine/threonine phosphatase n=1 Tax=Aureococcus anophagefferens TaxID=44056 RepID=A0ABR1FTK3_AURAN